MTAEFDADSGRLRLEPAELDALVSTHRDGAAAPAEGSAMSERTSLHDVGALTSDGVHPALAPGLDALLDPWCELGVVVTGNAGAQLHQAWVAPEAAAVLLQLPEGWQEFATLPPAFLPVTVARVVRLGRRGTDQTAPRPETAESESFELPTSLVRELLAEDERARRGAALRLVGALPESAPGWIQAATEGAWRAWQVETRWLDPADQIAGRALTVLDSPAGLLAVQGPAEEVEQVSVVPATPSTLWRELTVLLPGDEEMARIAGDSAAERAGH